MFYGIRAIILVLLCGVATVTADAQSLCLQNPSLEGTPQPHVVPSPWQTAFGTPDTQPGSWGISQPASNGSTYVSALQAG